MKRKVSRAGILFLGIVLLVAVLIFTALFMKGKLQKPKRYEASFIDVFDTVTEIVGYGKNKEEFTRQAELLKEKLQYYNNLYDIYHSYDGMNNIKTINDNAGIKPVKVDREIIDLLLFCRDMYDKSSGKLNIAYGSVLKVWHTYRSRGMEDPVNASLPPMEVLEEKEKHTDITKLIIDEEASTVFLEDKDMSLDVGSVGKGYGVQRVVEYAKEIGAENMLVSVGGNISAIGTRDDGTRWRLGIQNPDPDSEAPYVEKIELENECVVTSGNYQRYYEVDGVRYSHIIDPDTRMPADYFASVSVVTGDSGFADALSTILYNMDYEDGRAYVESLPNVEAMWIFDDGSTGFSSGFETYITD